MLDAVALDALQSGAGVAGGGTMLSTLLALSAMLLALSVAVQIVQEIFKFLRSSPSRVYTEVLTDGFGGWIGQLAQPSSRLPLARGPFQFFRSKPGVLLLPLTKEQLKSAVDTLAPDWVAVALESLKAEVELQQGRPENASKQLRETLEKIEQAVKDGADAGGAWNARSILSFLERWEVDARSDGGLDAAKVLRDFYRQFLPQRSEVDRSFEQVQTNYEWTYQRHNLRLTFVFALLIAFFLDLPFDGLLQRAASMSPEQAVALAERAQALYQPAAGEPEGDGGSSAEPAEGQEAEIEKLREQVRQALDAIQVAQPVQGGLGDRLASARRSWWPDRDQDGRKVGFFRRAGQASSHLMQSLLTALLVCFGAPFWDRITKLLLRANRPVTESENG